MGDSECIILCSRAASIHFIGKLSIKLAISHKFISRENIATVDKVPHAQLLRL